MLSLSTAQEKLSLMQSRKVLILGGTRDARQLAFRLIHAGHDVTTSFAGVTEHPVQPEGKVRVGGFGGVEGLRQYLQAEKYDVLVDATHPFAAIISANAAEAAGDILLLRLERPAWTPKPNDNWLEVADIQNAVDALPLQASVMLTIGRKEIAPFLAREDLSGVARMIEPTSIPLPAAWALMLERPPFTLDSETTLLRDHNITHLVSKNAGSSDTETKLTAARNLQIPVVMIARPFKPHVTTHATVEAINAHISKLGSTAR
jgi:precorrin-6A/cobalt-precorrin-6A reductase